VNITEHAQIGHVQSSNDVGADSIGLVVLTPINVGATGDTSSHEGMRRLNFIKLSGYGFAILYPSLSKVNGDVGCDRGEVDMSANASKRQCRSRGWKEQKMKRKMRRYLQTLSNIPSEHSNMKGHG